VVMEMVNVFNFRALHAPLSTIGWLARQSSGVAGDASGANREGFGVGAKTRDRIQVLGAVFR
jgi:hypothetical protein